MRGELEQSWTQLPVIVESEKRAAELEEPDDAELQTMSEKFRYERDLITEEETESWLDQHGLSAEEFSDYFLRHYWRDTLRGKIDAGRLLLGPRGASGLAPDRVAALG